MWKLLEQAAKSASANASGYVSQVQEKAQSLAAAVQDEASTLLNSAMGSARASPVDEILYEELDDFKEFCSFFSADEHTHEIACAVDEDPQIRELHDTLVPLELSYDEFWCRYFFRKQQEEKYQKEREKFLLESKKALEQVEDEEDDTDDADAQDEALDFEHQPMEEKQPALEHKRETSGSGDQEGVWLLRAARDAERKAASQWRQKARDLHHQLQEAKQQHDEKEQKALKEWEEQLQTLCDTYETKMAAVTLQIDEARAAGYDEGVRESQAIVESVRQAAEDDMNRLRADVTENVKPSGEVEEKLAALTKEKEELQRELLLTRERLSELEKRNAAPASDKSGEAALAEITKEKDLWRMRALKMKKLKDLVQAELTSLRQRRDANTAAAGSVNAADSAQSVLSEDHSKLQDRMNELQTQLANAVAGAEARTREAYEKGVVAGKTDAEQRSKQDRDQAFQEGYKKAQSEAKSEMGVLKAELGMFRAFHESAAHAAEMVEDSGDLLDDSLDDISLADGAQLCSPTSSVSIFTDNGKNDFNATEATKSTDDWGEW